MPTPKPRETIRRLVEGEIASWLVAEGHPDIAARVRSGGYRVPTVDSLGTRIAAARAALDMSCADLADRVGVTRMQVYRWEAGTTTPSFETLAKVARALRTTSGKLLPG